MAGRKSKKLSLYIKEKGIEINLEDLAKAISIKNSRTQEILLLKEKGMTFEEIGNKYGVTKQRIRFIIMKFIKGIK